MATQGGLVRRNRIMVLCFLGACLSIYISSYTLTIVVDVEKTDQETPDAAVDDVSDQKDLEQPIEDVLPQWMKDYFVWHQSQRSSLTADNWQDQRYVVMRCRSTDPRCGGTADRLKPVPLILHWAARTKRILLLHWGRPAALEEFLLPSGLVDWRVPDYMLSSVIAGSRPFGDVNACEGQFSSDSVLIFSRIQSWNGGLLRYNELNPEGPSFEEIYHDIWTSLFTPTLPIQALIIQQMERLNLRVGEYAAAHLRGLYGVKDRPKRKLEELGENAVKCASNLIQQQDAASAIYFASDSKVAMDYIVDQVAPQQQSTYSIVALRRDYEPLHVEKTLNWQSRNASEYYDTFVDLYILAMSKCVSYNVGGYGQWGLFLSGHVTCFNKHANKQQPYRCEWGAISNNFTASEALRRRRPLLLPPLGGETGIALNGTNRA